jgi:hypothetical protein
MKDLGFMHYFLGLEVWQRPGEIFLSQSKSAVDVLRRFGMMDCKYMTTPMISNLKKLLLNLKQLQEPFSGRMAKTLAEI